MPERCLRGCAEVPREERRGNRGGGGGPHGETGGYPGGARDSRRVPGGCRGPLSGAGRGGTCAAAASPGAARCSGRGGARRAATGAAAAADGPCGGRAPGSARSSSSSSFSSSRSCRRRPPRSPLSRFGRASPRGCATGRYRHQVTGAVGARLHPDRPPPFPRDPAGCAAGPGTRRDRDRDRGSGGAGGPCSPGCGLGWGRRGPTSLPCSVPLCPPGLWGWLWGRLGSLGCGAGSWGGMWGRLCPPGRGVGVFGGERTFPGWWGWLGSPGCGAGPRGEPFLGCGTRLWGSLGSCVIGLCPTLGCGAGGAQPARLAPAGPVAADAGASGPAMGCPPGQGWVPAGWVPGAGLAMGLVAPGPPFSGLGQEECAVGCRVWPSRPEAGQGACCRWFLASSRRCPGDWAVSVAWACSPHSLGGIPGERGCLGTTSGASVRLMAAEH